MGISEMFRKTPLGNVSRKLPTKFHEDRTIRSLLKVGGKFWVCIEFFLSPKKGKMAISREKMGISKIFQKTPLGNVPKKLRTKFHKDRMTGSWLKIGGTGPRTRTRTRPGRFFKAHFGKF